MFAAHLVLLHSTVLQDATYMQHDTVEGDSCTLSRVLSSLHCLMLQPATELLQQAPCW